MSELQSVIEQVNNQASHRDTGCLSMKSERLLVAEIERLRRLLIEANDRALIKTA
jgi:peptide deformylase